MKYLVVSDNHGDRDVLVDIVSTWEKKVDGMFHCGDSELKDSDVLWNKLVVVAGNCDYQPNFKKDVSLSIESDRVYMTHGHLFNVNMGLTQLSFAAKEQEATLCFYGHTHKLKAEMVDGILYLNPGSISQPRGMYSHLKTYAIVESTDDAIRVDFYTRDHQIVSELTAIFPKS